ncbi:ComEC family competence protein [Roseococcus sp. SYP-B2431]|nr:ComEC family competence protein [Roseococcus sp. SYP-B2431]
MREAGRPASGPFATGRIAAILAAEQGRLALWLPVAVAAGILLYFLPRFEPPDWWGYAALAPAPLALWLRPRFPLAAWTMALLGAAGLGFALTSWHAAQAPPPLDLPRTPVVLGGTVAETDLLPGGVRITLSGARWEPDMPPARRLVRVRLRADDRARPGPGDRVAIRALVRLPSPPAYPGAWDFQRAAYFEGVGGSGFALGPLEILDRGGAAPPLSATRARIEARVTGILPGAVGAVAAALLTGGQSAIPPAEMQAMRDSGLAHLLSVSGLHIAIVMGLAFGAVRAVLALWPGFALRWGTRPFAAIAALAMGFFFMLLTGSQVPMQRSFLMAVLVTLALLAGRRALSPRVLAFAALGVMALQPAALLGPSFQMSFAAVMALIAGYEAARPWFSRPGTPRPWWWRPALVVIGSVATSAIAGAATTPFGLHHFGRLQLYGVAANALAVPLTSLLVMPAGMAALALLPFGLEAWPLRLMGWGIGGILAVAREVAGWPGAALATAPLPAEGLALLSFGLCWLCLWRTRWRLLGLLAIAAGLVAWQFVRLPDAMASADGRLFALQSGGQVFLERRPGASRFIGDSWLRGLGDTEATPLPEEGEPAAARIRCRPEACTMAAPDGAPGLILLRPPMPPRGQRAPFERGPNPACGQVPVILSPEPVRGDCRGSEVVDRFSVWRDGAHAVWLEPAGPRVLSDRAWRGDRPWVPPRPLPRPRTQEPPAEME